MGGGGETMAKTVVCAKCESEKEGLEAVPVGGAIGATILESVCSDCWSEWRETSMRLINHYGINLGDPGHRAQLRQLMREFLNLSDEE